MASSPFTIALAIALQIVTSSATTVTLPDGTQLLGANDLNSVAFKGIPFAAPPVNDLRWSPPQPWVNPDVSTIRDATDYGNICYQEECVTDNTLSCSEDCLFLNVFVNKIPEEDDDLSLLPVAFYIYGGTYITGASNDIDGGELMSYWGENSGILVTINYRLNVFGFLGSDNLRPLDIENGSTGNYGIQDQRMALKWVQDNIKVFGGDPKRVSIFGESAGAGSITSHLVRSQSWDYFQSAIMESGTFPAWSVTNMSIAENVYSMMLENTKCNDVESDTESMTSSLSCLQNKTTEELFYASSLIVPLTGGYFLDYAPTIDGVEATTHPWISLSQGIIADKPLLYGFNRDEGAAFTTLLPNATEQDLIQYWQDGGFTTQDEIDTMLSIYIDNMEYPIEPLGYSKYWWASSRSTGDIDFSCPAKYTSQLLSSFTSRNSINQTYVYYFAHLTNGSSFVKHTYELTYVFHLFNEYLSQHGNMKDKTMSEKMSNYWGSFFFSNDHNPNELEFNHPFSNLKKNDNKNKEEGEEEKGDDDSIHRGVWPHYTLEGDEIAYLLNTSKTTVLKGLKKAECDFLIPILDNVIRTNF